MSKLKKIIINDEDRSIHAIGAAGLSFLALVGVGFFVWGTLLAPRVQADRVGQLVVEEENRVQSIIGAFAAADIDAHSFIVYDPIEDKIIYEERAYSPRPLASLSKIMTAVVALENTTPETEIVISEMAISEAGDNGLLVGERWNVRELVSFMLVTSSNDAAYALAETVSINGVSSVDQFVFAMNQKANDLGLDTVSFDNPSGLDIPGPVPSAFGSAYDIAKLMSYARDLAPVIFTDSAQDGGRYLSVGQESHIAENTNEALDNLPALVISKTGFTNATGGNLAFTFDAGPAQPLSVVLLGSTFKGRFDDAKKIVDTTLKVLPKIR